jgi:hypothetical protein
MDTSRHSSVSVTLTIATVAPIATPRMTDRHDGRSRSGQDAVQRDYAAAEAGGRARTVSQTQRAGSLTTRCDLRKYIYDRMRG